MHIPDFFEIHQHSPFDKGEDRYVADYDKIHVVENGPAPRCPKCNRYIGTLRWNPPFEAEIDLFGKGFPEVIPPGTGPDMLVTERFRDVFLDAGLTGLKGWESVKIVKIRRRKRSFRDEAPVYLKAAVERSRTTIDHVASGSEFYYDKLLCSECLQGNIMRWERIVFVPDTWDGIDVFRPRGLGGTFCTEHFVAFCAELNVRNLKFTNIRDNSRDFWPTGDTPSYPPRFE